MGQQARKGPFRAKRARFPLVPPFMGSPPKPSEAGSVGRGGATERASFAACGEARDSKSAPTKGVLQLLQYSGAVVLSQQPQGGRA